MATKKAKLSEVKLYECEVRRRRVKATGGYESFWKLKTVQEASEDGDTDYRCKDCQGEVKLHVKRVIGGPASHAEHRSRLDSEYCPAGMYFQQATDGRSPRLSASPVK